MKTFKILIMSFLLFLSVLCVSAKDYELTSIDNKTIQTTIEKIEKTIGKKKTYDLVFKEFEKKYDVSKTEKEKNIYGEILFYIESKIILKKVLEDSTRILGKYSAKSTLSIVDQIYLIQTMMTSKIFDVKSLDDNFDGLGEIEKIKDLSIQNEKAKLFGKWKGQSFQKKKLISYDLLSSVTKKGIGWDYFKLYLATKNTEYQKKALKLFKESKESYLRLNIEDKKYDNNLLALEVLISSLTADYCTSFSMYLQSIYEGGFDQIGLIQLKSTCELAMKGVVTENMYDDLFFLAVEKQGKDSYRLSTTSDLIKSYELSNSIKLETVYINTKTHKVQDIITVYK